MCARVTVSLSSSALRRARHNVGMRARGTIRPHKPKVRGMAGVANADVVDLKRPSTGRNWSDNNPRSVWRMRLNACLPACLPSIVAP